MNAQRSQTNRVNVVTTEKNLAARWHHTLRTSKSICANGVIRTMKGLNASMRSVRRSSAGQAFKDKICESKNDMSVTRHYHLLLKDHSASPANTNWYIRASLNSKLSETSVLFFSMFYAAWSRTRRRSLRLGAHKILEYDEEIVATDWHHDIQGRCSCANVGEKRLSRWERGTLLDIPPYSVQNSQTTRLRISRRHLVRLRSTRSSM